MNKDVVINYIQETENIRLTSDYLEPEETDRSLPSLLSFNCVLKVDSTEVPVKLLITSDFPEELPKFFLSKFDELGFLPHIEPNGSICYLEKESVYINIEHPKAVFQASVELTIRTLSEGLNGVNKGDFREEFHVFWERNKYVSPLLVMSFIGVTDAPKIIHLIKNEKKAILFDTNRNVDRQKKIFFKTNPSLTKAAIYIPINKDCELVPPKYDSSWNIDEFVLWLKQKVSLENWNILVEKILNKNPTRFEYIILGIPRITGATLLVGVQLKPKRETNHPILAEGTNWGINLLEISRLDTASILPRGGANIDLQNKKVLLIGCGSVGSHVALMLAKTGLGSLYLVDNDKFHFDNVQRFSIGLKYVGKYKVEALKEYIEGNFVGTSVSISPNKIKDVLRTDALNLSGFDLIISATGDPAANFYLNKKLKNLKIPFIISWNEPYGIGGHALLSIDDLQGCYRCLFRDTYNISSFAAFEQAKPFYKKHLGCGEVFTPYSALDSIRTSELTVRLCNRFLTGKEVKPQIISWVGDNSEFLSEGYKLSTRYIKQTQDDMNKNKFDFINLECPHCKK